MTAGWTLRDFLRLFRRSRRERNDRRAARASIEPALAQRRVGESSRTARPKPGWTCVFATMGCNFADFDNDGWLDFYLGTGRPI